jgi:hypothetical protein
VYAFVTAAVVAASAGVPAADEVSAGADEVAGALVSGALVVGAGDDEVLVCELVASVCVFAPPLLLQPVAASAMAPRRLVVASSVVERMVWSSPDSGPPATVPSGN